MCLLTPLVYWLGILLGSFVYGWDGPALVLDGGLTILLGVPLTTCFGSLAGLPIHGAIVLIFAITLLADDLRWHLLGLLSICLLSTLNVVIYRLFSGWGLP